MEIIYAPTVLKNLSKIPLPDLKKVKKKIESLKSDPLSGKNLKGEFEGLKSLRAWPLRIIYIFDSKKDIIKIVAIDYRGQVYKK
jgi:mRNA-degrading endonuclease RelE of RelBE toxin-antitoxin system